MVDSNDRERVQESADELQKMVSTQSPGEEKSLCPGVRVRKCLMGRERTFLSVGTVTRSNSPCFESGSGRKYKTDFSLEFSLLSSQLSLRSYVGRGELYQVEGNILLSSCFAIWKCHFDWGK